MPQTGDHKGNDPSRSDFRQVVPQEISEQLLCGCACVWQMLNEGVRLGRQGDGRVSTEGLISNVEDIIEKLDYYLELIDQRRKYFQ